MTQDRVRRRPRRAAIGVGQAGWRTLVNPYRPIEILDAEAIETLHRASLRILQEIGVEVLGDRALDLCAAAGATVDRARRVVRFDGAQVEELVRLAPSEFTLHARNPERSVRLGGTNLVYCAVGGPAFVTDLDRGRRAGNHADFVDYVRLIGSLDVIHQEGGGPLEPTDLPVATRHLDMYHVLSTTLDKTWHCLGSGATVVNDAIEMTCLARGIDRETLIREPSLITIVNTNSPLRLDGPMSDGLIEMATWGQPVVATPFTLAGAMTPATLAGAIAQQNAEALFCVALAQLVRPGAPWSTARSPRTSTCGQAPRPSARPSTSRPPSRAGRWPGATGCRGDPRTQRHRTSSTRRRRTRSEMAVWGAVMGGVNLLYQGAGWLEGGLTASYEKLIVDAEILQMMAEVLTPFRVDEAEIGVDAIAAVGHGGHFFGSPHTLERYETAFYRPLLSDWRNFETWQEDGARTATERANGIWKRLLAEFEPPPMDPGVGNRSTHTWTGASARSIGPDGVSPCAARARQPPRRRCRPPHLSRGRPAAQSRTPSQRGPDSEPTHARPSR